VLNFSVEEEQEVSLSTLTRP